MDLKHQIILVNKLLKLGQQSLTVFVWWDNVKTVLWGTFVEVFSLWQDTFKDTVRAAPDQGYTSASFHLGYKLLKAVDLLVYLKNLKSSLELAKLLTLELHFFL